MSKKKFNNIAKQVIEREIQSEQKIIPSKTNDTKDLP